MANRNNTSENVILARFLHIGDRVRMNMDEEARGWGRNGQPDGTEGTVLGFKMYDDYYGRTDGWMHKPGKYRCNGAPFIRWDNGAVEYCGASDLQFVDESLKDIRRKETAYHDAFEYKARIEDLPQLPYWEHDLVRVNRPMFDGENVVLIQKINYDYLGDVCNDGVTPYPCYEVTSPKKPGCYMAIREADIVELVQRGDFWMWEHDRDNLKFPSLKEKAVFFTLLGEREELRNSATSNYAWTQKEALAAIARGEAHVYGSSNGFFGSGPSIRVYRFPNMPEFGEELRAETLKGHGMEEALSGSGSSV